MASFDLSELIVFHQFLIILLFNKFANLIIVHVNPEVHVTEEALIIMVTLFLSIGHTEVLERVIIYLSYVFEPLRQCLLVATSCHVNIDKSKRCVLVVESDSDRALITRDARETALYFHLS